MKIRQAITKRGMCLKLVQTVECGKRLDGACVPACIPYVASKNNPLWNVNLVEEL